MTGQGQPIYVSVEAKTEARARAALRLDGLACRRGGRIVFAGLDLMASPGDAVRITGPNGAGKSSLIRILAGLLRPYAGTMAVEGKVTLADEALALEPERALGDALSFWTKMDGASGAALDTMGLSALAIVPVRLLSTGQRKRAALARAIASGADIWLLDEPGNGLDTDGIERLTAAIEAHRGKGGIAFFTSHFDFALRGVCTVDLASFAPAEEQA